MSRLAILEAFADSSHDALFSQDGALRIVMWNRGAERMFGYHAEDIVGGPVLSLFPEHVRLQVQTLFDAVLAGDPVDYVETEIVRRDGMAVPIALSLRPIGGPGDGLVGVAHDLTEQRLAQAALAETEARLSDTEAATHAGRWLWDVDSGAVQWSEEMHRIHDVDPASFEGTLDAHVDSIHPDDAGSMRAAIAASVASGRPLDVEYRVVRADGSVRRLHTRAEPTFGAGGAVVGLHGYARDITSS
jgi:PAS domain S-box-containing protein